MKTAKKINGFALSMAIPLLILFFGSTVHAQFIGNNDVTVTITPANPGPLEDTAISLSSLTTDLNVADIQWTTGGHTVLSGTGKATYAFKTGLVGTTTTITATISIPGVPAITKTISIAPGEADILWEATDSYVPPFYKGKALLSSEGMIKIVAIPNIKNAGGAALKPGDFTYNWSHNYNNDQAASGYGKNYYSFRNSYLNDQEQVTVDLASISGNYRATKNISLVPTAPNVLVYQNDPSIGIKYQRAIKGDSYFSVGPSGVSLIAEPYYFSPKNAVSSDLQYTWTVNGGDIPTPAIKNIFSIKPAQNGIAELGVAVSNVKKIFQTASRTLLLNLQTQ
jgi:hypothetical protein